MIERTRCKTVTFLHPFELSGADGEQAAGTYTVETTEEPISDLSFIAYRRVSKDPRRPALHPACSSSLRSWFDE